jgi:hypothetical protein
MRMPGHAQPILVGDGLEAKRKSGLTQWLPDEPIHMAQARARTSHQVPEVRLFAYQTQVTPHPSKDVSEIMLP